MAYLSFDIGSSSVKAALIGEDGSLLGLARRALPASSAIGDRHEADASAWIEASFEAGAQAVSLAKRQIGGARGPLVSAAVRAIAVSGNGPTLVATDASGVALGPALSWLDRRASAEAAELSAILGMSIDPSFYLPKACYLWRGADDAERDRLRWFFSCPEHLAFVLSGEACAYLPHPGYEPYIWNSSSIAALGLPEERFPRFAAPGEIIGRLKGDSAERLGIEPGIAVVAGFPDFLAAIVGSASVEEGIACDRTGSSEALNICAPRPYKDATLFSLPHPVPALWNVSGGVSTSGSALAHFAHLLGTDVPGLIAEAGTARPGAEGLGFLPYLSGERAPLWDPRRRGSFFGISLAQGRPELCRSICEGIAYGLRLAADIARSDGIGLRLVRASGRAAENDFLCELKARILRADVEVPEILDCELAGDAAAMAFGLGEASSLAEAASSLVRITRRYEASEPLPEYERGAAAYEAALKALENVDRDAARSSVPQARGKN
jgi:Sugar (pentulose and hexulose) kinases